MERFTFSLGWESDISPSLLEDTSSHLLCFFAYKEGEAVRW